MIKVCSSDFHFDLDGNILLVNNQNQFFQEPYRQDPQKLVIDPGKKGQEMLEELKEKCNKKASTKDWTSHGFYKTIYLHAVRREVKHLDGVQYN